MMIDLLQSIAIVCLAFAFGCQYRINRKLIWAARIDGDER